MVLGLRVLRSTPGEDRRRPFDVGLVLDCALDAAWRSLAFWSLTARSLSTGRGAQIQHCHSSGTWFSTMLKQAAWDQREHESQPMEKPSSKEKPQMQEMESELWDSGPSCEGGERGRAGGCLRFAGMGGGGGGRGRREGTSEPEQA
ncbi:hypothetical protein GSI_11213 [Ganoderma sinense ZZ0214-1]|uniref:Uncharacterized protein n=1 Tax=Ganoderma sinense ZZ0214-1 TaxID=1077348 RepID=A0A2G8RYU0_9APHY|nr:hypothetical protein GSI_11213 [Ganoderma sinense ZZ0214-1]